MKPPTQVIGVGFHDNVPSDVYHGDPCEQPSLSSGVARVLIEKTPAHAFLEHVRLGGSKPDPTPDMILGNFVHGILAGDVHEFLVGDFDNYMTKAAKEFREAAVAAGRTPILQKNVDRAERIAKALREKAAVGVTNNPFEMGKPEVTAIWQEDGAWLRARYDRLILDESGYADIWDWKTTGVGTTHEALLRIILDKGYHIQAAHYTRGLRLLAPRFAGRISFVFAFVETEEPFAVRRVTLSEGFLQLGAAQLERAIRDWRQCLQTNTWPDGSEHPIELTPPTWYLTKVEDAA